MFIFKDARTESSQVFETHNFGYYLIFCDMRKLMKLI